ncbi:MULTISPECIES: alanine racemase [unclassified Nocardioides]|uniref:alanine racemase n=1 Tax=unclassified Nocardioides TaxID=2615069 RepID=UPI0009F033D0|nr:MULTISPECIES: alanine racemase [unclassified Nocardioides]GAW52088.1 alanine racemase [Nocardioides sp. PD653-B2]GAW57181.1 alanine racemase [Nocardioides sp. PD653]
MSHRPHPEIVVDLDAVRHNVRTLRDLTGVPSMTVVKADGYGHGLVEVARAAREAGSEWVGVATIDEALTLRRHGDVGPLLCWLTVPGDDWAAAIDADVEVTAYSVADLDAIAATGRAARVQLKVDTGLSRGGATIADWPGLVTRALEGERDGSWRVTGLWSHLAASDEPEHPANDTQERVFREALEVAETAGLRPDVRHLANSAAGILRPSSRFDLVRFGLASYGLDPAPGHTPDLGLVPAMTVRTPLVSAKPVAAGAGVSYGHTWVADTDTTLGLVPVGYGDGVLRAASNAGHVLVDGKQRAIRGRVCMDQFVVDLGGDLPEPGADVVLFGPGTRGEPTAQDWAEASGTISYEIVTRIGGRLTRRYVDDGVDA